MTDDRETPEPTEATVDEVGPTPRPTPGRLRRGPIDGGRSGASGGPASASARSASRSSAAGCAVGARSSILSLYLVLLGGFTWMVELIMERTYSTGFGGSSAFATAAIGQGIFAALLMLETLLVVFLAPMSTAGAISLEREKQTLEMLAATPITSAAIVFGKLVSALVYVWLLIAASIPLTAVVFVFGGVAPEDLVRGYLVLVVTALGFGSFGLFCSSIVKRTQAATAITIFGVLGLSIGTLFVIVFWQALASPPGGFVPRPGQPARAGTDRLPEPVPRPGGDRPDRRPVLVRQLAPLLLPVPRHVRPEPERRRSSSTGLAAGHRQGRSHRSRRRSPGQRLRGRRRDRRAGAGVAARA